MPVYGIEEEVFVLEPDRPTARSLYYLARLLWSDPQRYYAHSAPNFRFGGDLRGGLVGGIEVSTGRHDSVQALLEDLAGRRRDLARLSSGLICPLGHLPDEAGTTGTCGLHLHVSGVDRELAYRRLVRYLPVLALALCHAPYAAGRRFGQSFRWARSFALGPLRPDPTYRFQDLIYSRRLGTVEIRVFDPSPDLCRLGAVLDCIDRLLRLPPGGAPADRAHPGRALAVYNRLRAVLPRLRSPDGPQPPPELGVLVRELRELVGFEPSWISETPADLTAGLLEQAGPVATYGWLDGAYRRSAGAGAPDSRHRVPLLVAAVVGVLGYCIPRLPYAVWKVWREWH